MNLDHIQLFIAVYRAGSFATVARALNIAPSSVSRAVAGLEEQLQTRLFQRTTRSLTPTQAGEDFFHRVEALIEELDLAKQELLTRHTAPSGTVRISASTSFGQTVLPPLLKGFYQRYPDIQLELVLSDQQAHMVEERFDLAIRHGSLNDSNLIARKLADVRYHLVASPGYLEDKAVPRQPEEILQHRLISFGYSRFSKQWNFRQQDQIRSIAIQPALTLTTAAAIKECACKHVGIALLPDWIIRKELNDGELVDILPDWHIAGSDFNTAIWLVYPSRSFLAAKTKVFMDYLQESVAAVYTPQA